MRFNHIWCYRRILLSRRFGRALGDSWKNLLAYQSGMSPPAGPVMAELDVTYRCNCRCRMCQRWRDRRPGGLSLADYEHLAAEFDSLGVLLISIAGGEPLLRKDIFRIVEAFTKYGMSVNLCTNGVLLEKYRQEVASSGISCVTVSLDGASRECHDRIRGVEGSCRTIERGIQELLAHRSGSLPILRVRMTVSGQNTREIGRFYKKWRGIADDVLLQPVHRCEQSLYTGLDAEALELDGVELSRQLQGTPLEKDLYMARLATSLAETRLYPYTPCYAGVLMVRIDPWGQVYPCLEQHVRVGSIREDGFTALWRSEAFDRERQRLAVGRPCRCWYNNTAMIGHFGTRLLQAASLARWIRQDRSGCRRTYKTAPSSTAG